jgi:hypothetical protein
MMREFLRRLEKLEVAYDAKFNQRQVVGIVWKKAPKPAARPDPPASQSTSDAIVDELNPSSDRLKGET